MKWQPIEAAPKDGTHVLVYSGRGCSNCPPKSTGVTTAYCIDDMWVCGRLPGGVWLPLQHQPTHWMEIPSPPDTSHQPTETGD